VLIERFIRLSAYDLLVIALYNKFNVSRIKWTRHLCAAAAPLFRQSLLRVRFTAFVFASCLFFSCVLCVIAPRASRVIRVRRVRVRLRRPDASRTRLRYRNELSRRVAASLSLPFALSLSLQLCASLRSPELTLGSTARCPLCTLDT
jgi:hypothetical protein